MMKKKLVFLAVLIMSLIFPLFAFAETINEINVEGVKENDLFAAVKNGDIQKVQQLISEGADVNAKNENGSTPLVWAVTGCNKEIAELLLSRGAAVNTVDNSMGMTPLMWAAHRCHKNMVGLLFAKGADIEMKDKNGKTPWMWSVLNRTTDAKDVVEFFLSKGVDVNAKDNSGATPLMWAAGMGNKEIVELLLSRDANINAENNHGATVITYADKYTEKTGQKDLVEFLRAKVVSSRSAEAQPWSNKFPYPYTKDDAELVKESYKEKWKESSADDWIEAVRRAKQAFEEWGPILSKYEYKDKQYDMISVSESKNFISVTFYPANFGFQSVEIRMTKKEFTVLSILPGP